MLSNSVIYMEDLSALFYYFFQPHLCYSAHVNLTIVGQIYKDGQKWMNSHLSNRKKMENDEIKMYFWFYIPFWMSWERLEMKKKSFMVHFSGSQMQMTVKKLFSILLILDFMIWFEAAKCFSFIIFVCIKDHLGGKKNYFNAEKSKPDQTKLKRNKVLQNFRIQPRD